MSNQDMPDEMVPNGEVEIGDTSPNRFENGDTCPSCGDGVHPEYDRTEYKDEIWHTACAYADHPHYEQAEPERVCPKCWRFVTWRKTDQEKGGRICPTCKMTFSESVSLTKEEYIERQGSAESDDEEDDDIAAAIDNMIEQTFPNADEERQEALRENFSSYLKDEVSDE